MKRRLHGTLVHALLLAVVATVLSVVFAPATSADDSSDRSSVSFMRRVCTSTLITGHRGSIGMFGNVRTVEDTVLSAIRAYYYGADQSETDYRMSSDGVWFQLHDPDLTRVTNGKDHRKIRSMTATQVRAVVLPNGSGIPELEESLQSVRYGYDRSYASRSGQLEIKAQPHTRADLQRFVDSIRKYGMQKQVMLTSAKLGMLRTLSVIAPEMLRAYVWYPNNSRPALSKTPSYVQGINIDRSQASRGYVRAAHRRGILISARNAQTPRQWSKLLKRRASDRPYNILTDRMPAYRKWCNGR